MPVRLDQVPGSGGTPPDVGSGGGVKGGADPGGVPSGTPVKCRAAPSGALNIGTAFATSGELRCSAGGGVPVSAGSGEIGPSSLTCQVGPGLGSRPPPITLVPFISQIAGVPSLFCQTMPAMLSPLKSLGPITYQEAPGLSSSPPPMIEVPLSSQIAGVPSLFCHRMSAI